MKNNALILWLLVAIVALSSSVAVGQPLSPSKEAAMQSTPEGPSLGALKRHSPSPIQLARVAVLSDSALPAGVYTVGQAGSFPTIDSAFNKLNLDGVLGPVTLTLIDTLYRLPRGRRFELGPIAGAGPAARITIRPAVGTHVTIRGDSDAVFYLQDVKYLTIDGHSNPPSPSAGIFVHALDNPRAVWNDCIDVWGDADYNQFLNLALRSDDTGLIAGGFGGGLALMNIGLSTPDSNLIEGNTVRGTGGVWVAGNVVAPFARPQGNTIRANTIGESSDLLGAWGITSEFAAGTIIEGNTVQFLCRAMLPNRTHGIVALGGDNIVIRNNVVHSLSGAVNANVQGITGYGSATYTGHGLKIYNNMVYDLQNTSTTGNGYIGGIVVWEHIGVLIAYNTVLLSGTGANPIGTDALGFDVEVYNATVRNNILVNLYHQTAGGPSTALWVDSNATFTSDHNDLYVNTSFTNSYTAYRNVGYRTLSGWQGAGYDPHSLSGLPAFRPPHLHIDSTFAGWLNGHATPIAGITTDFDGQIRNASTPDIGADEFDVFSPTVRRVPSQYATIQAAINASVHGDTVLVSDGTYYENIRFKGKKIVVASTYATTGDTSHISHTIIDGSASTDPDSASVVYFISGEDTNSVLCGFTVRGGRGTYSPLFTDMEGGGVLCWESGAKLIRNIITGNTLTGRPHCYGGGISSNSSTNQKLIVEYNIIRGNSSTSTTGQAFGAGISTYYVDAVIKYNDITDNIASTQAYNFSSIGGGLDLELGTFLVEGNLIARNKALSPNCVQDDGGAGGGVWVFAGNANLLNNRIVGNVVQSVFRAYGGGICMWADAVADLRDIVVKGNYIASNTVSGNSGASLSSGGGIYSRDQRPRIENNIIVKNIAPYGGAFSAQRSSTESASADNSVTGGVAMGRRARVQTMKETADRPVLILDAPVLINNTIAYNRATANQGAAIATVGSWTPKVINTIAWGDTGSSEIYVHSGSISVLYSDIQGTTIYPGQGNINAYPQFADTTYRLADQTSPCLQTAIDSVQVDGTWHHAPPFCVYGMARPTPAGTPPDIGACENPTLVGVDEQMTDLPATFALDQNFPNPFNPSSTISYGLPHTSFVTLTVYNTLGQQVAQLVNEQQQAGYHDVVFRCEGVASGMYFYRLQAGSFVDVKKLVLLR